MEYLTFYNGYKMPAVGLGMFLANDPVQLEAAINRALEIGYRHFDTAYRYRNEGVLGKVLNEWLSSGKVKREELFITTKLPYHGNQPENVGHFMKESLRALQLEYVDLYLVHGPISFKYVSDDEHMPTDENGDIVLDTSTTLEAVWSKMEDQVMRGRAKSIGLSNFNAAQVQRIMKTAKVPPVNLQVEANLYFQQNELRRMCRNHNITIAAYGPLGSPGRSTSLKGSEPPQILEDHAIAELAKKYNKTPAQILIRFLIQLGLAPIPKSTNPERLKENFNVFDFELNDVDMTILEALDKGEAGRTFTWSNFKGIDRHPEYPYRK